MPLKFRLNSEGFDADRQSVTFEAMDGDKLVLCQVSTESLRDAFDNSARTKATLITAYRMGRSTIETVATRKYEKGLIDDDGRVTVQSLDLSGR